MTTAGDWKARPAGPDYEATRQRLVGAAASAVRASGVGALRLDSVADAVGLHRSSVYRYFDSKEDAASPRWWCRRTLAARPARASATLGDAADPERFVVEGLVIALTEHGRRPGVHRSLLEPSASASVARIAGDRALTEGIRPLVEPMFVAAAHAVACCATASHRTIAMQWLQIVATGLLTPTGTICGTPDELTAPVATACSFPSLLDDGARLGLEPRPGQGRARRGSSELGCELPARRGPRVREKRAAPRHLHHREVSGRDDPVAVGVGDPTLDHDELGADLHHRRRTRSTMSVRGPPEVADVHVGGDERLGLRVEVARPHRRERAGEVHERRDRPAVEAARRPAGLGPHGHPNLGGGRPRLG